MAKTGRMLQLLLLFCFSFSRIFPDKPEKFCSVKLSNFQLLVGCTPTSMPFSISFCRYIYPTWIFWPTAACSEPDMSSPFQNFRVCSCASGILQGSLFSRNKSLMDIRWTCWQKGCRVTDEPKLSNCGFRRF